MNSAVIDQTSFAAEAPRRRIKSPLTLRELLTPVFYYKWQALVAFMIPVALALIAALLAQTMYTSQSRLLILLGGDYVFKSSPDSTTAQTFDRPQIIHAETEILTARSLRMEAIRQVGLARVYPGLAKQPNGLEKAADQLDKDLKVENIPTSNIVELSLRNRDRQVSADLLNKLVEVYLERRTEVFKRADSSSVSAQRDALAQRLQQLEGQISAFSTRYRFGDYAQEFAAVQGQQSALQAQLQAAEQQIAMRAGRASQLSALKRTTPSEVQMSTDRGRSAQLDGLTQNLVALQAQRREAAEKYRDGYPLITDLDQRIANVQAQIRAAPTQQVSVERQGLNPIHQQIATELADSQGDVAGLRNAHRAIKASLAQVDARLGELVRIGPEYRELVRSRTLVEGAFDDLAKTAENAGVDNAVSRSRPNVRVIEPATPPLKGKTGRMLLLAAGIAVGCAAAFATVVLASAMSEVMVTPRDVEEKLGVPVLLAVSAGDDDRRASAGRLAPTHLTQDDGRLLLRLISSLPKGTGRVMQLVSAHEGEGVSTLVRDLAAIAAAGGARKVLLVDIEPPEGQGAAARLGERGHTLHAVTAERRTMRVDDTTLYVSTPIGAGGLRVDEAKWAKILAAARSSFDLVLIDAPALQRSSTGVEIAALADITLAVVEAETTRAAVARRMIEQIEAAGGQVIGAVLNKRGFYIPRFIYRSL